MTSKQNGFTLVELAIALMVIGLLIGGVLKGQELITNARVTALIRQNQAYDTAAMIFRNTYNALPGDIKRPNRIPNCTEEICTIGGNGNGKVLTMDTTPNQIELYNFYPHLTKAGMIQGVEGGTPAQMSTFMATDEGFELFFPQPMLDSGIRFMGTWWHQDLWAYSADLSEHSIRGSFHIHAILLPFKFAEPMDSKIDDGLPCSGIMILEDTGDCTNLGNTYTEQSWADGHSVFMQAGF